MRAATSALALLALAPLAAATLAVPAASAAPPSPSAAKPAATQAAPEANPPVSTPTIEVVRAANPLVRAATPAETGDTAAAIADLGQGRLAGPRTQVIEVGRSAGFSMVGVTWTSQEVPGTVVHIRTRAADGTLGEDIDVPVAEEKAPEANLRGTDAVWVGQAARAEVTVTSPDGSVPAGVAVNLIDPLTPSKVAAAEGSAAPRTEASPDAAQPAAAQPDAAAGTAAASVAQPYIRTRAQWGANEGLKRGKPYYSSSVKALVVHHTAGSNNYSCADVPGILRGLYSYATQTLGWSDIAYNFLIDKCGGIWEAQSGGIATSVSSTHAGGFNSYTQGVSLMGNYEVTPPSAASINSLVSLLAWKAASFGINPKGSTTLTQQGGDGTTARWYTGYKAYLPTIFGHRSVGNTSCPGQYTVNQFPSIVNRVAAIVSGGARPAPPAPPARPAPPAPAGPAPVMFFAAGTPGWVSRPVGFGNRGDVPLMCDFDGNGEANPVLFRRGRWYASNSSSTVRGDRVFDFGQPGDIPLCGDWNRSGRDGIAVFRDGRMYFKYTAGTGSVDFASTFGQRGDAPLIGDWNDDGYDTIGIARRGVFFLSNSNRTPREVGRKAFGNPGDVPMAGDWNRDGNATVGVFRRGRVFLSNSNLSADRPVDYFFGNPADRPMTGPIAAGRADTVSLARGY